MKNFRLPKWAVLLVVALVFGALAADWVRFGVGTHLAVAWLSSASARVAGWRLFPLWGGLVGLVGRDILSLTCISIVAGLVAVWLVAIIFGTIFGAAVRVAKEGGAKGANEFSFVESAGTFLSGLAFALTPGFLSEATRISPLMVALVPPLVAIALLVKRRKIFAFFALVPLAYSVCELVWARKIFLVLAFPAFGVWFALGVMPALVLAWCVRRRWLLTNKALLGAFGAWALAILVMGATNFTSGKLEEGRLAYRIVSRIIADADANGKIAIVSEGPIDDLYFFMLPEHIRLISLARERDPEYGRELSAWVKDRGEDLAFAAELGPMVLIDEWQKLDRKDFEAAVAIDSAHTRARVENRMTKPEPEKHARTESRELLSEEKEFVANATLGSIAGRRGDYERAVRYLRRAIATGRASIAAKNDLAWSLLKLNRYEEAEVFAREAVEAVGDAWTIRETLAAILIRSGRIEEGERELQKAEELAGKAGIPKGRIVSIELDRACLYRAKGDHVRARATLSNLLWRKDLTDEQRKEVEGLR